MLKNFLRTKKTIQKNALFFHSSAQTDNIFTYNSRLLCELKHKVLLSKIVCEIFHFRLRFVFFVFCEVCIFVFNRKHDLFDYKNAIIPFTTKKIEKPHTMLLPDLRPLSCNDKF